MCKSIKTVIDSYCDNIPKDTVEFYDKNTYSSNPLDEYFKSIDSN